MGDSVTKSILIITIGILLGTMVSGQGTDIVEEVGVVPTVTCRGFNFLTEREETSLQEACQDGFQVILPGYSGSTAWTVKIMIDKISIAEKVILGNDTRVEDGDDVTDIVGAIRFSVDTHLCDNRDAEIGIAFKNSSEHEVFKTDDWRITIMCNFLGVDLVLASPVDSTVIDVQMNDTKNFAMVLVNSGILDTMVSYIDSGNANLPLLGHSDACYYLIAFLTKRRNIATPKDCANATADKNMLVPEIMFDDIVLDNPVCIRTEDDLTLLNDTLLQWAQSLQLQASSAVCGMKTMVFLLDPIRTVYKENRCNNYVTFTLNLHCHPQTEQCELVRNPFSAPGDDTRFIVHDPHDMARMFHYENDEGWMSMRPRDSAEWMMERLGYGRLKVLESAVRSQIKTGALTCDIDSLDEGARMLTDIEGEDAETDVDKRLAMIVPMIQDIHDFLRQIHEIQEMMPSTPALENVTDALRSALDGARVQEGMSLRDSIGQIVYRESLNATLQLSKRLAESHNITAYEINNVACKMAYHVSRLHEYIDHFQNGDNDSMVLQHVTQDVTHMYTLLKYAYPESSCICNVFSAFLDIVKASGDMSADWTTRFHGLYEGLPNKDCTKPRKCLLKLQRQCRHTNTECVGVRESGEADDICLLKYLRTLVREQQKILGFHDIRELMMKESEEQDCDQNPFNPKKGPVYLWKIFADGLVKRGSPNIDNTKLCWESMAVCTCENCGDHGAYKDDLNRENSDGRNCDPNVLTGDDGERTQCGWRANADDEKDDDSNDHTMDETRNNGTGEP